MLTIYLGASIMDSFNKFIQDASNFMWVGVPYALIAAGILFLFMTKAVQFRMFPRAIKNLFSGKHTNTHDDVNISSLQSFMTGLASRVGTGNIAGVASAIVIGGPGAVFWMWVAALLGMATAFSESSLAQLYKTRNNEGVFVGGPAFYIEQGLKLPVLSVIFSIVLAFTYGFCFNSIQANQIANTVNANFGVDKTYVAIFVTAATAIVIFGSLKYISKASTGLVTAMALLYVLVGIAVLTMNHDQIIPALEKIFHDAFHGDAALGATVGVAIQYGVKRGLFSNEAGMGSAPNIAASASTLHPAEQGFVQMIGVFFDTIIICTFTALIIVTSGIYGTSVHEGAALTSESVSHTLGDWSGKLMTLIVFLFAFSSIVGNYAYSLAGLKYFTQNHMVRHLFALAVCAMVFYGSVTAPQNVWNLGDFSMAIMTFLNLFAIVLLCRQVKLIIDDYTRQVKQGVHDPVFNSDHYPELRDKLYHSSIWSHTRDESHDLEKHK